MKTRYLLIALLAAAVMPGTAMAEKIQKAAPAVQKAAPVVQKAAPPPAPAKPAAASSADAPAPGSREAELFEEERQNLLVAIAQRVMALQKQADCVRTIKTGKGFTSCFPYPAKLDAAATVKKPPAASAPTPVKK